jgi:hypothetical protein
VRWFWRTTWTTFAILILYPLSLGPVLKFYPHAPDAYFVPYWRLIETCPAAGDIVLRYNQLWVHPRPCISSQDDD